MKSQAYAKTKDPSQEFYAKMKKTFEVNPRHPVIKELLKRVQDDAEDPVAISTAQLLFETATLRSGYSLDDQIGFAERIEAASHIRQLPTNFLPLSYIIFVWKCQFRGFLGNSAFILD